MNDGEVLIQFENTEPLRIGNKIFKSAYDWKLTEKEFAKAAEELGETQEKKELCLRKLKEKLSNESKAKYRQDDFYLLRFLRVRKYDASKAFQNVKSLYEYRKKYADFFIISPEIKYLQELNYLTCLPYADEEGRIRLLINFKKWNPYEFSFEEMSQAVCNVFDIVSMNPKCQINGIIAIFDFSEITFKHFTEVLKKGRLVSAVTLAQTICPWRIKKWIILNTNTLVRLLFTILRPLLRSKIVERCIVLGSDITELHKHVTPALLPKRLKGSLEEEECDMSQQVLSNLSYIRYERSFRFL